MESAIANYLGTLDARLKHEVCLHAQAIFVGLLEPIAAGACAAAPEACVQIQEMAFLIATAAAQDFIARECR